MAQESIQLSIAEELAFSTVRLECELPDGVTNTGTGFFYAFAMEGKRTEPAIVTNRHVVKGALRGRFFLTTRDFRGGPQIGNTIFVQLDNFQARWIPHPDADIDLCALPILPLLDEVAARGVTAFYVPLNSSQIPTDAQLWDLDMIEDITMVGYPNGLWDQKNNMPVFRRGATATHPALDWNGRPEFLIDAACFHGSSGSPVFLYNSGGYIDKRGNVLFSGTRLKFLGILRAGPLYWVDGQIFVAPDSVPGQSVVFSAPLLNLGFVIKAKVLHALNERLHSGATG